MSYDEIELLAAQSEREGGYLHAGLFERFEVGDTVLDDPKDMMAFLQHLLRRSQNREGEFMGKPDYQGTAIDQARQDARREVLAAARKAMQGIADDARS